jgi:lipopolysaccharide/colanic/teichoic acid biosynthesis glycosyltransferase
MSGMEQHVPSRSGRKGGALSYVALVLLSPGILVIVLLWTLAVLLNARKAHYSMERPDSGPFRAKRTFDVLMAAVGLLLLAPVLLVAGLLVAIGSPGGAFFRQERVGRNGRVFKLLKFRSMRPGSEAKGQITTSDRDPRITPVGHFLRRTKLDELPQLWNVLVGDMSIVGPRPEVPRYVALYTPAQRQVLSVKPGITSLASIAFINENEVLGHSSDPERTYVEEIIPAKLELDLKYALGWTIQWDLRIVLATVLRMVGL